MKIVEICPDIPDDASYSGTRAIEILGMNKITFRRYANMGRIKSHRAVDGQRRYYGKDIKQFWRVNF